MLTCKIVMNAMFYYVIVEFIDMYLQFFLIKIYIYSNTTVTLQYLYLLSIIMEAMIFGIGLAHYCLSLDVLNTPFLFDSPDVSCSYKQHNDGNTVHFSLICTES